MQNAKKSFMYISKMRKAQHFGQFSNAPVICIPGSLGAGDSGDIAGPKCGDLTFNEYGSAVDVPGF